MGNTSVDSLPTHATSESREEKDTKPCTRSLLTPSAHVGWSTAKLQPLTKPGFWPAAQCLSTDHWDQNPAHPLPTKPSGLGFLS